MFRISLAITILLAIVTPFTALILGPFITVRELSHMITPVGAAVVRFFCQYFVFALVLYAVFRAARLSERFSLKGRGSTMVLAGNSIALVFVFSVGLLSTIEGGGPAFVVSQFGFLVLPIAWFLIAWGLARIWQSR